MNIYKVIAEATREKNNWIDVYIVQAKTREDAFSKVYKRLVNLRYETAYEVTPVKIDISKPYFISSRSFIKPYYLVGGRVQGGNLGKYSKKLVNYIIE